MVIPAPLHQYTYEQYVSLEKHAGNRHEFLGGEIYAMAGGTPGHAALAGSVIGILRSKLPQQCRVYTSDLRVRVQRADLATYPDGAVICGKTELASDDAIAAVNPCLLVEVTNPSTEHYDRNQKAEYYRTLSSLKELIIVSHRERLLTMHQRAADGTWSVSTAGPGQMVRLESIGAELAVDDVYRDGLEG